MQETWKNSDDKCTFIILHRETFEDKNSNEIEAMIGDTNIFLKEEEGSKLGKSQYRNSESKPCLVTSFVDQKPNSNILFTF